MCGISGFWGGNFRNEQGFDVLRQMGASIKSRGPDDSGVWFDSGARVGLSHRRLSIVDLSAAGNQPMVSASGRYVIVFNGEIYNHLELRTDLAIVSNGLDTWRGHSDTETLLACLQAWGLEQTLQRAVGMFALALWDRELRTLAFARDRLGEKPLYYGIQGGVLLFASELKALRVHPAFSAEVDRGALSLYLRHNCVPSPYSIYKDIFKLAPGTFMQVDETAIEQGRLPEPQTYWSFHDVVTRGMTNPFAGNAEDAINELERVLKHSVKQQLVSDVPLGAFLSGGVDSSTIVSLMQVQSRNPVKTFTVGFHEEGFNEAEHAKSVASYLGTEHTELYVTSQQALEVIPRLPVVYDEPFADPSQIPTYLVANLARQHVTVSLSGDAGDELFGGYNRYLVTRSIWNKLSALPRPVQRLLSAMLTAPSPQSWNSIYSTFKSLLPASAHMAQPGDKLHKLADIFSATTPQEIYERLVSHWKSPADVVHGGHEPLSLLRRRESWPNTADLEHWMMALDTITYLPDDILVKVDRAAMGVSLETRVPMLDHRVVELAWRIPLGMKIRDGQGKWLLRQVLYRYLPRELIERPKMGFGVPIDSWLRGPLRDWAENLLDESRLRREGFFEPGPIRHKWREHLSGQRNWQYHLWNVLMFQAWLEEQSL
jgi:asparagine synthase (glutamine-hydrolysing)